MKNLGFKIFGLALSLMVMSVLMTSCQKDNSFVNETVAPTDVIQYQQNSLRVYYDNGGDDYGCSGSGGNCLKTVVIKGTKLAAYDNLFEVVNHGGIDAVKNTIQEHFEMYAEDINSSDLESVLSDELRLTAKDFDQNEVRYLVFSNHSEENVAVYPMR